MNEVKCIIWVARVIATLEVAGLKKQSYKTVCVEAPAGWPGTAHVLASEFGMVVSIEPDRRKLPRT